VGIMDKVKIVISTVGMLFFGFLVLIGSIAGIMQLLFMILLYLFRKPLRFLLRLITKRNIVLVVIFGTIFGLIEELL